jgi:hypothetical protein
MTRMPPTTLITIRGAPAMGRVLGLAERLWAGFSYSRKQCLANESALFDHLLKDRVRSFDLF